MKIFSARVRRGRQALGQDPAVVCGVDVANVHHLFCRFPGPEGWPSSGLHLHLPPPPPPPPRPISSATEFHRSRLPPASFLLLLLANHRLRASNKSRLCTDYNSHDLFLHLFGRHSVKALPKRIAGLRIFCPSLVSVICNM